MELSNVGLMISPVVVSVVIAHYCGVAPTARATVSANPIVISRSPAQPSHNSRGHVSNVQVVVTIHITAE